MSEDPKETTTTETETSVESPTVSDPAEDKRVEPGEPVVKTTETVTEKTSGDSES
jgi:hypothetical protein